MAGVKIETRGRKAVPVETKRVGRSISLSPVTWGKIDANAHKAMLSRSEYIEKMIGEV